MQGGPRTISINRATPAQEAATQQSATPAAQQTLRDGAYTPEQLNRAWDTYIANHPKEHILTNTMRAGRPTSISGHNYKMLVENEMQQTTVNEAMYSILQHLRDTLFNDHITLAIEINQGAASPHTWNEREVLAHMVEHTPALKDFIDDFKLTIG